MQTKNYIYLTKNDQNLQSFGKKMTKATAIWQNNQCLTPNQQFN